VPALDLELPDGTLKFTDRRFELGADPISELSDDTTNPILHRI
jgi:hypothetical protein